MITHILSVHYYSLGRPQTIPHPLSSNDTLTAVARCNNEVAHSLPKKVVIYISCFCLLHVSSFLSRVTFATPKVFTSFLL